MRTVTGPMLVLPTAELSDQPVMLWSTSRFQPIANGGGGFAPPSRPSCAGRSPTFPDPASIDYLREAGVDTVVLLRDQVAGTPWERSGDVAGRRRWASRREDLDDDTVALPPQD